MKFWNFRLTGIAGLMMVAAAACGGNNATIDPLDTDTDADTDTDTDTTPKVIGTTLTAAQLDTANVYKELTGNAKCDVTVVQINYQTPGVQPEEMTNASAAVLIPSGPNCPGPFPLIAFSRGTKLEKAYTNADPNSADTLLLMTFFVSQGYAVVATDYLGYALSNYPYHPYMHANTEASAIIDSIRATRKAAASLGLTLNGKIMVAGYSQGGHAAMAAQRAIERDNADEFNLVAAAHLAGPYNVSKALIDGVTDPILGEQYFVPFQITSWQRVYGNLYSNASDVFNSPYDSFVESLLPAVIYPNDLGRLPPVETAPETARDEIFKPAYLTDLATNPNNPTAVAAKKQDLLGWNPQAPTTLCGGSQDPVVSFSINAQAAYDDFKSRGVSPDTLKLVDVDSKIEHMFGSQDRRTFIKNYHGKYELPFCYQVAKELFDQYKSPLSANNVNLIFVVSPDVAYNTPGDINPDTANLSNQGLQRSLMMATYLKKQVLGGRNVNSIYAISPMSHLQTEAGYPDMSAIGFIQQFALLNQIALPIDANGNPYTGNSYPIKISYAEGGVPAGVDEPTPPLAGYPSYCPDCTGLDFGNSGGNNDTLVSTIIDNQPPGYFVFSAPWETTDSLLKSINTRYGLKLTLPATYMGTNYLYAISIPSSGTANLVTYNSNLNPKATYPVLPSSVESAACTNKLQPYFSTTRIGEVNGAAIPPGINTNSKIHIIRHAEAHPDPGFGFENGNYVAAGQWRALLLADALQDKISPNVVYSIDPAGIWYPTRDGNVSYVRPSLTVLPYAIANNLPFYLSADLSLGSAFNPTDDIVAKNTSDHFFTGGKFSNQTVLAAWESGHIKPFIKKLIESYGGDYQPLPGDWTHWPAEDYDTIWTVAIDNHGNLSVDNALCEGIDSESIPATAPLY